MSTVVFILQITKLMFIVVSTEARYNLSSLRLLAYRYIPLPLKPTLHSPTPALEMKQVAVYTTKPSEYLRASGTPSKDF